MPRVIGNSHRKAYVLVSRHRKELLSLLILVSMWAAVIYLDDWEALVFAMGTLLLGTDYKVLNHLSLGRVYSWIEAIPDDVELAYEFWRYWYIDENITPLKIVLWNADDGRTIVENPEGFIEPGTKLFLCVKDDAGGERETHEYDLRLGIAEVTNTEPSDDGKTVFLGIDRWFSESYYEDENQRRKAQACRRRIMDGDLDDDPFVKIKRPEELNAIGVNQWETLFEEIEARY